MPTDKITDEAFMPTQPTVEEPTDIVIPKRKKTLDVDPFDAPIPGESLTEPLGSAIYEKPPTFTGVQEASEVIFDKLTKPRNAAKIVKLLEAGAPAESLARILLKKGFEKGQWSPDLGLALGRVVMYQIAALGSSAGVKNMKFSQPDSEMQDFLRNFEGRDLPTTEGKMQDAQAMQQAKEAQQPKMSSILTADEEEV